MFNLPEKALIKKQLPKAAVYRKFNLNNADKTRFDKDISRIDIVAELSPNTVSASKGSEVSSIFVLQISLKQMSFDEKNIALISKLINQSMVFVLVCSEKAKLAVYHNKLFQTEWQNEKDLKINLIGANLDVVYQNIITQIGNIEITDNRSLDEQIEEDDRKEKLQKEIEKLERMAKKEVQPKRKFELHQEILRLKNE